MENFASFADWIYDVQSYILVAGGAEMTKTLVDLDDELIAEAMVAFNASTKKDAITKALTYSVAQSRKEREAALDDLELLADEGAFDFDKLDELDQ